MNHRFVHRLAALIPALALLAGCGDGHNHAGHDHDHDHDHGQATASNDGHTHASPHGGVAVALGDHQFHLDFLADTNAGTLQAWVMDAHAEAFVRVAAPSLDVQLSAAGQTSVVSLAAQANPATGETVGATSHFRGTSEALRSLGAFDGLVPSIEIRGTTFRDIRFQYPAGDKKP